MVIGAMPPFILIYLAASSMSGAAVPQQTPQSAKEGAFTAKQADRGAEEYRKACASCHKDDMSGSTEAPSLIGDKFLSAWQDSSVGDLVDLVRSTMPYDQPNSLPSQAYVDIVAAMLQRNNYRSGTAELPLDPEALKNITLK